MKKHTAFGAFVLIASLSGLSAFAQTTSGGSVTGSPGGSTTGQAPGTPGTTTNPGTPGTTPTGPSTGTSNPSGTTSGGMTNPPYNQQPGTAVTSGPQAAPSQQPGTVPTSSGQAGPGMPGSSATVPGP